MDLVADVASRALRDKGGDFRVHLRRRLQAAEVGPEVLEDDGAAVEGSAETACVANHRREVVVAVMDRIGEERLLGGGIDKRSALGQAVERPFILGAHQAAWAGLLDHLANALEKRLTELLLVCVLHARVERIEALLPQLLHALVAIACRRAAAVQPYAVELIPGHKFPDEVELPLHEPFLADAELPQVRPISLVFGGRLGRLGAGAGLGAARGVGLQGIRERLLFFGDLLEPGTRLVTGLVHNQPFGMPIGELRIPGEHVVGQDRDLPFPERRHLRSQEVEREVGMHPPLRIREIGIAVHVLGEYGGAIRHAPPAIGLRIRPR